MCVCGVTQMVVLDAVNYRQCTTQRVNIPTEHKPEKMTIKKCERKRTATVPFAELKKKTKSNHKYVKSKTKKERKNYAKNRQFGTVVRVECPRIELGL